MKTSTSKIHPLRWSDSSKQHGAHYPTITCCNWKKWSFTAFLDDSKSKNYELIKGVFSSTHYLPEHWGWQRSARTDEFERQKLGQSAITNDKILLPTLYLQLRKLGSEISPYVIYISEEKWFIQHQQRKKKWTALKWILDIPSINLTKGWNETIR